MPLCRVLPPGEFNGMILQQCLFVLKTVIFVHSRQPLFFYTGNKHIVMSQQVSEQGLTLYGHVKTTTTDHYTAIWLLVHWPLMSGLLHLVQQAEAWAGCGPAQSPPCCTVPNVTAHPSMASVPTSYYLTWPYNCLCTLKG